MWRFREKGVRVSHEFTHRLSRCCSVPSGGWSILDTDPKDTLSPVVLYSCCGPVIKHNQWSVGSTVTLYFRTEWKRSLCSLCGRTKYHFCDLCKYHSDLWAIFPETHEIQPCAKWNAAWCHLIFLWICAFEQQQPHFLITLLDHNTSHTGNVLCFYHYTTYSTRQKDFTSASNLNTDLMWRFFWWRPQQTVIKAIDKDRNQTELFRRGRRKLFKLRSLYWPRLASGGTAKRGVGGQRDPGLKSQSRARL